MNLATSNHAINSNHTLAHALSTHSQPLTPRAGWYRRLHATFMAKGAPAYNRMVGDHKQALLGSLSGSVLEIGPGTGTNLSYYQPDIHWIGVEPSLAMHTYLTKQLSQIGLAGEVRTGVSEALDAADNSVDAVVGTLVLCSVDDQIQTLAEILRVLKPGGKYVFIEHVAAPKGTARRRLQNLLTPVWHLIGDGCHPNRETWGAIERGGFNEVHFEHFQLPIGIEGPHIAGIAIK